MYVPTDTHNTTHHTTRHTTNARTTTPAVVRSVRARLGAATLGLALVATACATEASSADESVDVADITEEQPGTADDSFELTATVEAAADGSAEDGTPAFYDSSVVHSIDIEFDQDDYDEMITIYETTGEKEWIEVTVTIDGTTYENVGLRLKGNSSLFGLTSETAEDPEDLPWLIRLDKYEDDQTHQGHADIVIRSNSTETAMNEALAVELLDLAGLATQETVATTLTVNGGETELRLAMEHPDEIWAEDEFGDDDGLLYKADSEGDYSYRGDDADAYEDVFDQKAGEDDFTPLTEFLDFINNADDATFEASLADHLDVDAFATYLAFQDLVGNFDDIDGPGNNSYLYFDPDTDQFTVVNWDLNLAFDTANVNGGGAGGAAGGGAVAGGGRPAGGGAGGGLGEPPVGGGGPGGAMGGNVLSERFMATEEFAALVVDATADLQAAMYDSGAAEALLAEWVDVLTDQASDLVDASTIQAEADAILNSIQGA